MSDPAPPLDQSTGANASGFAGQWSPENSTTQYNATYFLIKQLINLLSTATLVQVLAVSTSNEVNPSGTVDVQPLVSLLDGNGNASSIAPIFGLPFFRLTGGTNSIIIDPKVGDIGLAVFADRDISSVKANKAQANPGSRRRFDMADGLYLGAFLTDAPIQYLRFKEDGFELVDTNGNSIITSASGLSLADCNGNAIDMTSTGINITGDVSITGTLKDNAVDVGSTHTHSGVTSGTSDTGPPVP